MLHRLSESLSAYMKVITLTDIFCVLFSYVMGLVVFYYIKQLILSTVIKYKYSSLNQVYNRKIEL